MQRSAEKVNVGNFYTAARLDQADQQYFTVSEVAADWHERMVLQRIMWISTESTGGQLTGRYSCNLVTSEMSRQLPQPVWFNAQ